MCVPHHGDKTFLFYIDILVNNLKDKEIILQNDNILLDL